MINYWILGHLIFGETWLIDAIDSVKACGKLREKLQSNNFLSVENLEKSF